MKLTAGRKEHPGRIFWAAKFGLSHIAKRKLSLRMLGYLENCKDDDARRILLGITEKQSPTMPPDASPYVAARDYTFLLALKNYQQRRLAHRYGKEFVIDYHSGVVQTVQQQRRGR
jgi:hypothetical protein